MRHVVARKATPKQFSEYFLLILSIALLAIAIATIAIKGSSAYTISISTIIVTCGLLIFIEAFRIWILRQLFKTHARQGDCISDEKWETITTEREGVPIHAHMKWESGNEAPLVLFLHGWCSDSSKSQDRAKGMSGFHILAMDLRGHGHAPEEHEFTALKCVKDAITLLDTLPRERISNIAIYGHSLGAFIALRLSSGIEEWWRTRLKCVVLESPMTNYNLILDEYLAGPIRLIKPLILRWLKRALKKIHPKEDFSEPETIMVPGWGIPEVKTLVVQAADDSRLGEAHYNLLMEHLENEHEGHVLNDLRHSGDSEHRGRTKITQQFLEKSLL